MPAVCMPVSPANLAVLVAMMKKTVLLRAAVVEETNWYGRRPEPRGQDEAARAGPAVSSSEHTSR